VCRRLGRAVGDSLTRDADEAIEPQTRRELIPIVSQIPDLVETWLQLVAD
jgi:hypothetical protein